jgi:hypothetical protein
LALAWSGPDILHTLIETPVRLITLSLELKNPTKLLVDCGPCLAENPMIPGVGSIIISVLKVDIPTNVYKIVQQSHQAIWRCVTRRLQSEAGDKFKPLCCSKVMESVQARNRVSRNVFFIYVNVEKAARKESYADC